MGTWVTFTFWLPLMGVVNKAAMNIGVQVSVSLLSTLGYVTRKEVLNHTVILFNFLRNYHTLW